MQSTKIGKLVVMDSYDEKNDLTPCGELQHCLNKCCEAMPIVHFKDGEFHIRCFLCLNLVKDANAVHAMTSWNKDVLSVKKFQEAQKKRKKVE